jgi:4-hydroxybenzoate polyprenyltransferase
VSGAAIPATLAGRLWLYQAERFPLAKHGVAIAAFAFAGVGLPAFFRAPLGAESLLEALAQLSSSSAITRLGSLFSGAAASSVAFIVVLLFFLQLRVADEHKDADADRRFRPERPVPRGLVELKELRWIAFGAAALQASLAYALNPSLLIPLALTWGWMALMTVEFFAPRTLKARPVLYLVSHMAIMPLIAWFAVACGLTNAKDAFATAPLPVTFVAFLVFAFASGTGLEIARKSWAPEQEREGVETYSKLWGPRAASAAVIAAIASGFVLVCFIFFFADFSIWFSAAAAAPAALGAGAAYAYGARPTPRRAETLERNVGLWAFATAGLLAFAAVMRVFLL